MSLLLPPLALSHDIEEGGVGANGDSRDAAWTDLVELSSDEPQLLARDFLVGSFSYSSQTGEVMLMLRSLRS